jgi:hypothetical protein
MRRIVIGLIVIALVIASAGIGVLVANWPYSPTASHSRPSP